MYEKNKSKKVRKLVLIISPNYMIKENLRQKVFKQILENIEKFKAYELKLGDSAFTYHPCGNVHIIEICNPDKKNKVIGIVRKFNFEVVSE